VFFAYKLAIRTFLAAKRSST